jgi:hypothetical protein
MKTTWLMAAALTALGVVSAEAADAPAGVIEHYGLEQAATPVSERAGWRKPKRILVVSGIPGIV